MKKPLLAGSPNAAAPATGSKRTAAASARWTQSQIDEATERLARGAMKTGLGGAARSAEEALAQGADPLARPRFGRTALMLAAEHDRADFVRALIPVSDLAAVSEDDCRWSPLMCAAGSVRDGGDCVEALALVSDPKQRDAKGKNALQIALAKPGWSFDIPQRLKALRVLARHCQPSKKEWAQLARNAVAHSDLELLEMAVSAGCDLRGVKVDSVSVGSQGNEPSEPLLIKAAQRNDPAMIALLLAGGCDPDFATDEGETPLMRAVRRSPCASSTARACVTLLAPVSGMGLRDAQGRTALAHAAAVESVASAKWKGGKLNHKKYDVKRRRAARLQGE